MGIVLEKVNFTWQWNWLSAGEENCPHGKEIGHYWVCFLKRRFGFHSAPNTHETFGVHSQAAITCLNHLIVNLAPHCYSRGQALALNAVIPTSVHASAPWSAKKNECFESERSNMSVTGVVNHGKNNLVTTSVPISGSGTNTVNGSWTGIVRDVKLVGHLNSVCMCTKINCCHPNGDILLNVMKEVTLQKKKVTWAGSESLWVVKEPGMH